MPESIAQSVPIYSKQPKLLANIPSWESSYDLSYIDQRLSVNFPLRADSILDLPV
jgi:hypothetical protein